VKIPEKLVDAARVALVVAIVFLIVEGPHIAWRLKKAKAIRVVVVDKTIPFPNYREHDTVPWLLHALKFEMPAGGYMDASRHYVGFDPHSKTGRELTAKDVDGADAIVVADTYGVYRGDYERKDQTAALERSPIIFGGLSPDEANVLRDFDARGGLVIAEFNTFGSPTGGEALGTMETLVGARWTHWVARYFRDLADGSEVPMWVGRAYEQRYKKPFDLKGGGFVMVREDQDILVLERAMHFAEDELITVDKTDAGRNVSGLPGDTHFAYWLDILTPTDADVIYDYRLHTTPEGDALLKEHALTPTFPAVLRRKGAHNVWYMAGDFVDASEDRGDPERLGILSFRRGKAFLGAAPEDARFLWGFYAPLLETLLAPRAKTR
jgi:hypothetical protein